MDQNYNGYQHPTNQQGFETQQFQTNQQQFTSQQAVPNPTGKDDHFHAGMWTRLLFGVMT